MKTMETNRSEWDNSFERRCIAALKSMDAPIAGWACGGITDVREDDSDAPLALCELCGCSQVRFVHHMMHPDYPSALDVGCMCAGIMEGDELAAIERERLARNRASRKRNFVLHGWERITPNTYMRIYKNYSVRISYEANGYLVRIGACGRSKKAMVKASLLAAKRRAYDLIDPKGWKMLNERKVH